MEQMNRKATRKGKGAARKRAKGAAKKKAAAKKPKRAAAAFKRLGGAKKTVTVTVARGPVSPAAREIIRSTSANLDLALRRLADR